MKCLRRYSTRRCGEAPAVLVAAMAHSEDFEGVFDGHAGCDSVYARACERVSDGNIAGAGTGL
eukprot:3522821-Rhodomonas_salina.2